MTKVSEVQEADLSLFLEKNGYKEVDRSLVADLIKEGLLKSLTGEDLSNFSKETSSLHKLVVRKGKTTRIVYIEKSQKQDQEGEVREILKSCSSGELSLDEAYDKINNYLTF